ncbi:MAG: hypothetical protein K2X97_00740, partial [Mycobacteriaceae bacterium]|nr:hypothetical protein [Mycobacteriaceae bacterium]
MGQLAEDMKGEVVIDMSALQQDIDADLKQSHVDSTKKLNEEFQKRKKGMEELRAQLNELIDNMAATSSILSDAARFWGKLATWQKIGLGLAITIPVFVLGVLTSSTLVFASILTAMVYTLGSMLLDDHYETISIDSTEKLKNGLGNVVNFFDGIMTQLEDEIGLFTEQNHILQQQNTELKIQVDAFTNANKILEERIAEFNAKLCGLQNQTDAFTQQNQELSSTNLALKESVAALNTQAARNATQIMILTNMTKTLTDAVTNNEVFAQKVQEVVSGAAQISEIVINITELQNRADKHQQEALEAREEVRRTQAALTEAYAQINKIQVYNTELMAQLTELTQEHNAANEEQKKVNQEQREFGQA